MCESQGEIKIVLKRIFLGARSVVPNTQVLLLEHDPLYGILSLVCLRRSLKVLESEWIVEKSGHELTKETQTIS